MRGLLAVQRAGLELGLREGGPHYGRQPARSLERLVRAHPGAAWVLFGAGLPMQQWFAQRELPVVLAGAWLGSGWGSRRFHTPALQRALAIVLVVAAAKFVIV